MSSNMELGGKKNADKTKSLNAFYSDNSDEDSQTEEDHPLVNLQKEVFQSKQSMPKATDPEYALDSNEGDLADNFAQLPKENNQQI